MKEAPVVAVVGRSDAGKTTFLEKLLKELKLRKIKVGTIKHDVHGFDIDKPGKDTWRHAQAGADTVVISSPSKVAIIKKVPEELSLDQVVAMVTDMDILLTEGYKRSNKPKIEINRTEHSSELVCAPDELIALVTDAEWDIGVPLFGLDDAVGVADLLVEKYNLPK
ncbi:molybdopterin-guanine dinucleotide biosynthesis protein B [Desulfofarcimen acetoxidans DSM 771]|jgi:molybdopterin-guanine dinucleotide biosynthesis protein B|uniref:Molybdopterin-guanine dinucleotide biosynthesis protein B n=1 Tax=Desulfofarcimen acetoxidans (strain ATCC 49208 / DSM 771 / KCTC 5769 / VKM B-1644 / 5575) TaxID=485916 RepID=C8W6V9_DESAS|nr:molybdopterin-guanine dinucleotide biosynthesis protein B [Desulfofarcimen acetoxidans]ACV64218.1 molybdopterin-guanine dinucleotide biosynthesis protein B [Desulfofarcimen acetoxidans DSM 771]